MPSYYIAFWNLENLFDTEHSPDRPEWLQRRLAKELEGWSDNVLNKKLAQLASIICKMNEGHGPDILGVCEVENLTVLKKLVKEIEHPSRMYEIAYHDCSDDRSIDVAFIYDELLFKKKEQFAQVILKRNATRDLFQVTLETKAREQELILIGNHWPARMGGQYDSEPYRIMAGETLAYWHERIRDIKGDNVAVLAMGDFNDQPFNRSLTDYALSMRNGEDVLHARSPKLYNMMWRLLGQQQGTFYGDELMMLDQFLMSKGLIQGESGMRVREETLEILAYPEMVNGPGRNRPICFGRPSANYNPSGFSDHLPICVRLEE